jgi:hypothetical protein
MSSMVLVQIPGEILEACIDSDGCHYPARPELFGQLKRPDEIEAC